MIKHKHQQLFDLLCGEFRCGQWPDGKKLPTQKELAIRYSVSVNVVSQTLELLKQQGFIKIKKGDGIYSVYAPDKETLTQKYSGERVFGRYTGAKTLTVLVEDYLDWQLRFWNRFFEEFSNENPDIELNVHYDHHKRPEDNRHFDIAIGSCRFIAYAETGKHRVTHADAKLFYPDIDRDFLLPMESFEDGIFPIGFVSSVLTGKPGFPEPLPEEGILDYLERVIHPGNGAMLLRQSTELFQNTGIDVLNRNRRCLDEQEKELLQNLFDRVSRLHREGRLLWPHGRFSDPNQVQELLHRGEITVSGRQRGGERPLPQDSLLQEYNFPHGRRAMIVPVMAVLDRRTCFVEEQLRLICKLRMADQQLAAYRSHVFLPLHKEVLPQDSVLAGYFRRNALDFRKSVDPVEIRLVDFLLSWELLFNMTGRRKENAVALLDQKIRYYYQYADQFPEQIGFHLQ